MSIYIIAILFLAISAIYASVGFGGGSSYIAVLLAVGMIPEEVRFIALTCNIIVVLGSSINYIRSGLIPWKKVLPILLLSIPLAYIGGTIQLDGNIYKTLAAVTLIIAAILMLQQNNPSKPIRQHSDSKIAAIGGCIGFLSGLIGIGGGIFLSPFLHLIHWQSAKVISATASIFILLNSISGIAGQLTNSITLNTQHIIILGLSVLIGGQIGNHLNIKILKAEHIKSLTAILIMLVGISLLFQQI